MLLSFDTYWIPEWLFVYLVMNIGESLSTKEQLC